MFPFRIAALLVLVSGLVFAGPNEPKKPVPKFKIGKATTFVDGPLDADGYIDYEAALNTLLKGKITPDTNAVVLLLKCFGPKPEGKELHPDFYKALGVAAPPPETGEYLVPHSKHFQVELEDEDRTAFEDLESRLKRRLWKADDSPKHAEWLKLNEKPLVVALEATRRKDYFFPMISRKPDGSKGLFIETLLPVAQKSRELGTLLSLRVTFKLAEGKIDDAFADTLAIHRLGRLVGQGGCLIDLLVGFALESIAHASELVILEHGHPTAKQALAYQSALKNLSPFATVAEKLQLTERFNFLDAIQSSRRDGFNIMSGPDAKLKTKEEIEQAAETFDWNIILALANTWYDKCRDAMLKPTRSERIVAGELIVIKLRKMKRDIENMTMLDKLLLKVGDAKAVKVKVSEKVGMTYVSLLIPAFYIISDAADRAEQVHRNGILAIGLAAHFADTGKYPDTLADLVPKYLAKVPSDAFNEKPLTYRKTDTGYLFYSVGTNGIDDGGKLLTDEPRGDDVGVRMPGK